jgi:hypothetical protein
MLARAPRVRSAIRPPRGRGRVEQLEIPAGLAWGSPPTIVGIPGTRYWRPTHAADSRLVATTNTYYVATAADGGNDLNTGTSPASPFRSVWKAINTAGVTASTIWIKAGTYYFENSWNVVSCGFNCNLRGYGGRVRLTTQPASVSWSSAGSGAYQTTFASAPYGVLDESQRDAWGIGTWLTQRASVAEVQALGGWYWTATTLTAKTFDGRAPDGSVWALPSGSGKWSMRVVSGVNFYMEDIELIGGYRADIVSAGQFTASRCGFGYSEFMAFNGVACTEAQLFDCVAIGAKGAGGGADGLAYQATWAKSLEVNCLAVSNGWDGADINNGSTAHGGKVIRLGGLYANNQGPNVADVVSSKSLTVGARIYASRAVSSTQRTNVGSDGATGEMWLAECSLGGDGTQDIYTYNAGAKVYTRRSSYSGAAGLGTVGAW